MDYARLLSLLAESGVICREVAFSGKVGELKNDKRIICAEIEDDGLRGITFWLYGEGSQWYLGLWTPRLFQIPRAELIPEIAVQLLSGNIVMKGATPSNLPPAFLENYRLVEVEP